MALAVAALLALGGCGADKANDFHAWRYSDWTVANEKDRMDCTIAYAKAVDPDGVAQLSEEERNVSAKALMPVVEQLLQSDQGKTLKDFIDKNNAAELYTTQTPKPILPQPISVQGIWTLKTLAGNDVAFDENNCTKAEFDNGVYKLIKVENGVPQTLEEGTYVEENAMLTLTVDGEEKTATVTGKILAMELDNGRAATFEQ